MKCRILRLINLLILFPVILKGTEKTQVILIQEELPLKISQSVDSVTAELENFVPLYMIEQKIPGVSIALISEGKVAWSKGFGVANTCLGKPVTPETLFSVASNSKVITAYIALRLVDLGLLSYDKPLNAYLTEPWLPPSAYRDVITLRHVASHSSGLGHSTTSRENLFAPGAGYSYSAIGFQYLQAVIEKLTGKQLEEVARELVFIPLGMDSSSFYTRAEFLPQTANGHVNAAIPAILFAVPFLIFLILTGLIGAVFVRIRTGRWRPKKKANISILIIAFILSLVPAFLLFGGSSLVVFSWLIGICGLILTILFTAAFVCGRFAIQFMFPQKGVSRIGSIILWILMIIAGFAVITANINNLPVPKLVNGKAEAAGSMQSTAPEMARFLIELSNPRMLSKESAAELKKPQINLSNEMSWGMGPGIQHSQQGDALWQWGQNIHYQSIMIIYPGIGSGVVVCTNSDLLNPDVALEIAYRALGGKIEPIRRAIHLNYNYREN